MAIGVMLWSIGKPEIPEISDPVFDYDPSRVTPHGLQIFSQGGTVSCVPLKFVQGMGYGFENKTKAFDGCFWAAR